MWYRFACDDVHMRYAFLGEYMLRILLLEAASGLNNAGIIT